MAPSNADVSVTAPVINRCILNTNCDKCRKTVRNGILCDSCDMWNHFRCAKVDEKCLPDENLPWICPRCVSGQNHTSQPTVDSERATLQTIVKVLQGDVARLLEEIKELKTPKASVSTSSHKQRITSEHDKWEAPSKTNKKRSLGLSLEQFPPLHCTNRFSVLTQHNDQVNGYVTSPDSSPDTSSWPRPTNQQLTRKPRPKPAHRVNIYSDSFGRGLSRCLGENLKNLKKKCEVVGQVKPSATLESVVPKDPTLIEIEHEESLTSKDFVVILGGANDVYANRTKDAATCLESTLEKLKQSNVIYVNVPHRHDLSSTSIVNSEITSANSTLRSVCAKFKNVSYINTSNCNREWHTKHGQHFNWKGKQVLANIISKIIKDRLSLVDKSVGQGNA